MQATQDRIMERNKEFGKSIDFVSQNKLREEYAIELRKTKRLENICKRRALPILNDNLITTIYTLLPELINMKNDQKALLIQLYYYLVNEYSYEIKLEALKETRRILSKEDALPIPDLIEIGYLPILVSALIPESSIDIQYESA